MSYEHETLSFKVTEEEDMNSEEKNYTFLLRQIRNIESYKQYMSDQECWTFYMNQVCSLEVYEQKEELRDILFVGGNSFIWKFCDFKKDANWKWITQDWLC